MEETNLSVHTLESPQDYLAICPDRDETNFSSRYIVTKYYLYPSFFAKSQHCLAHNKRGGVETTENEYERLKER